MSGDISRVHGVEYAFGAHDHATSGIFEVEPRQCPGFTFRKSICIGRTNLGPKDARTFMERLAEEYSGNTYHLITKNCNHFCNDACVRLTGKPIPNWVNRLARLGLFCKCVLPASLNESKVPQIRSGDRLINEGLKKKLKSQQNATSSSNPLPSTMPSKSPTSTTVKVNTQKRCVPAASAAIHSPSPATLALKL